MLGLFASHSKCQKKRALKGAQTIRTQFSTVGVSHGLEFIRKITMARLSQIIVSCLGNEMEQVHSASNNQNKFYMSDSTLHAQFPIVCGTVHFFVLLEVNKLKS